MTFSGIGPLWRQFMIESVPDTHSVVVTWIKGGIKGSHTLDISCVYQ